MDQESVRVPCPHCRIISESADPGADRWECPGCGHSYVLRRCSACAMVSHVSAIKGWHQRWDCVWCQESNTGFIQRRDPASATVADLAADVASHRLAFAPPEPPPAPVSEADRDTQPVPIVTGQEIPVPVVLSHEVPPAVVTGHEIPGGGQGSAVAGARRRLGRVAAFAGAAIALVAVVAAGVAAARGGRPEPADPARVRYVAAAPVRTVILQDVPGLLTVAAEPGGRVTLTGQVRWSGRRAPLVAARLDRAAGVLRLTYRCAAGSPCTGHFRLAVPGRTATVLRQPSGHVLLSGLAGPLRITAAHVDVSAAGLRSPSLVAVITSGHLTAAFAAAPGRVTVRLRSAQATLRLPGVAAYRVTSQVTSGYLHDGLPQAAGATRAISAYIDSGELDLLSS